jgi:hypothetical protein
VRFTHSTILRPVPSLILYLNSLKFGKKKKKIARNLIPSMFIPKYSPMKCEGDKVGARDKLYRYLSYKAMDSHTVAETQKHLLVAVVGS